MSSTVWPRTAGSVEFSNGRASDACLVVLLLRSTKASCGRVWGGLLVIVGSGGVAGLCRGQRQQGRLPSPAEAAKRLTGLDRSSSD